MLNKLGNRIKCWIICTKKYFIKIKKIIL